MPIFILSQPIQSGKTTLLEQWIQKHPNTAGILTPDKNGKRLLYDIANQSFHTFQIDAHEEGVSIGKFVFSKEGFEHAQMVLRNALTNKPDWLIIDEVGRLEMDRKEGLEPAVAEIISLVKSTYIQVNLLLVIRDYLLDDAIDYYKISDAKVLTAPNMIQHMPIPNGLILCGGQSKRMGADKALIHYHHSPQYLHAYDTAKPLCSSTFLSCNTNQKQIIESGLPVIIDDNHFANAGPITGLLSYNKNNKNAPALLIGCDYPNASTQTFLRLLHTRDEKTDVVCYRHPETGFDEPLLAIYESSALANLNEWWMQGNQSLRLFLQKLNVKRLNPVDANEIKSFDCRETN